MKKYTSKDLKEKHFFVLYDDSDNIICCFADFEDLRHCFGFKENYVAYKFNHSLTNYIQVLVENKKYKLYTFC